MPTPHKDTVTIVRFGELPLLGPLVFHALYHTRATPWNRGHTAISIL